MQDAIYLKIQNNPQQCMMISYDLTGKKQIGFHESQMSAEFIFDTTDECYVWDDHGISKLKDGETFNEFHAQHIEWNDSNSMAGKSWGSRLIPSRLGTILLIGNTVVMPYSQLSYIQQCTETGGPQIFYPSDYYKILGDTLLHRYKYDPIVLEQIIDCYYRIDKRYVLSVLVKSHTVKSFDTENFKSLKSQLSVVGNTKD